VKTLDDAIAALLAAQQALQRHRARLVELGLKAKK
jgi:hypothetical protein